MYEGDGVCAGWGGVEVGAGGQRVLCEGRIEVLDYRSQPNMQKFAMPLEAANGRA